jgi:hypothetical protein
MPDFQPTQVEFGDIAGYGQWDIGHGREHIRFVQALAAQTTPILLPDADLLSFLTAGPTMQGQVETHMVIHSLLRTYVGVQGVDYSEFRLDRPEEFYAFLGYHETEHAAIRAALGLT